MIVIMMASRGGRHVGLSALTPVQREIVVLAASGLPNGEIAARLGMSPGRATMQTKRALHKLGLARRSDLVLMPDWS
jgi:DNA-binding CsgD family transcriptional regulator